MSEETIFHDVLPGEDPPTASSSYAQLVSVVSFQIGRTWVLRYTWSIPPSEAPVTQDNLPLKVYLELVPHGPLYRWQWIQATDHVIYKESSYLTTKERAETQAKEYLENYTQWELVPHP